MSNRNIRKTEKKLKRIFELLIAENFPKLMRLHTTDSRSSEMPWKNNHQSMPRHVIYKLQKTKTKRKSWKKPERGNMNCTYRGTRIRITLHLFSETMQARYLKYWKKSKHQSIFPYLAKLSCQVKEK